MLLGSHVAYAVGVEAVNFVYLSEEVTEIPGLESIFKNVFLKLFQILESILLHFSCCILESP